MNHRRNVNPSINKNLEYKLIRIFREGQIFYFSYQGCDLLKYQNYASFPLTPKPANIFVKNRLEGHLDLKVSLLSWVVELVQINFDPRRSQSHPTKKE